MSHSKEEILRRGWQPQETQHSMKRRKPWHNYHLKGTYMLTLVVEGRRPVLGRLCSNHCADAQGQAAVSGAYIELSALGKAICNEEIRKISTFYPMVEIWKLCIMPDHIHMIVRVKEDLPEGKHLGHIVAGFKGGCSRAWWRIASYLCADAQGVVAKDARREWWQKTRREWWQKTRREWWQKTRREWWQKTRREWWRPLLPRRQLRVKGRARRSSRRAITT